MKDATLGIEVPPHPMTVPPKAEWPSHVRNLFEEIASMCTPLDSRTDYNEVIRYLRDVYEPVAGAGTSSMNVLWVLGQIKWREIQMVRLIDDWILDLECTTPTQSRARIAELRRNRAVILGHSERLAQATVKEIPTL